MSGVDLIPKISYNCSDFGDGDSGVHARLASASPRSESAGRQHACEIEVSNFTLILPLSDWNRNRVSHLHGPINLNLWR